MAKTTYQGSGDIIEMTANKDYVAGDSFILPDMKCVGVVVADVKKGEPALVRIRGVVKIQTVTGTSYSVGTVMCITSDGYDSTGHNPASGVFILGWTLTDISPNGSGLVLLGGPQL